MKLGIPLALGAIAVASAAACGGAGAGSSISRPTASVYGGYGGYGPPPVAAPPSVPIPSTAQVVSMALPTTSIGVENDPTFGVVAGYTQQRFSQVLGFVPGTQIMVRNGDTVAMTPHTFSTVSTTGFPVPPAPAPVLSFVPAGGPNVVAGFSSGTVAPGALAGPFTLVAGTYFMGCAFHYTSNTMRTVLVVSPTATPRPQATPGPGPTPTTLPGGGLGGF
jgi:hypothetical protein